MLLIRCELCPFCKRTLQLTISSQMHATWVICPCSPYFQFCILYWIHEHWSLFVRFTFFIYKWKKGGNQFEKMKFSFQSKFYMPHSSFAVRGAPTRYVIDSSIVDGQKLILIVETEKDIMFRGSLLRNKLLKY